jgi:hypothetical protein
VWVLLDHNKRYHLYREGYFRLSSEAFSLGDNLYHNFVHLTNNAIQKFSDKYGLFESGSIISHK